MKRILIAALLTGCWCAVASELTYSGLPEFEKLDSVMLAGVHYNPATQVMLIKMQDDTVVEYSRIPESVYQRLKEHPLKGGFYRGHIANRFPSRVIPPDPEPEETGEEPVEEPSAQAAVEEPIAAAPAPAVVEPVPEPPPVAVPVPVAEPVAVAAPDLDIEEEIPSLSVLPEELPDVEEVALPEIEAGVEDLVPAVEETVESAVEAVDEEILSLMDELAAPAAEAAPAVEAPAASDDDIDDLLESLDDLLK